MGNIVNPLAIRLGKVQGWIDGWISKDVFYPELLHSVIRLKERVRQFFTGMFFERRDMFIVIVRFYFVVDFIRFIFLVMMVKLKSILKVC